MIKVWYFRAQNKNNSYKKHNDKKNKIKPIQTKETVSLKGKFIKIMKTASVCLVTF